MTRREKPREKTPPPARQEVRGRPKAGENRENNDRGRLQLIIDQSASGTTIYDRAVRPMVDPDVVSVNQMKQFTRLSTSSEENDTSGEMIEINDELNNLNLIADKRHDSQPRDRSRTRSEYDCSQPGTSGYRRQEPR